ncbi:MAG: HEPN domain-containing protein [Alphaproteobacteria bacterium]|nr:HEPN domain-containing protein [Alphaproteobacteria bacterium]
MTKELMDKSRKALVSAKMLLDSGDADGAVSRAYYAMFDAARAALGGDGNAKSHAGLIGAFGLHLVKPGKFPAEQGRALNRVQELRSVADYLASPVPLDRAAEAVADAEAFVAAVRDFLKKG